MASIPESGKMSDAVSVLRLGHLQVGVLDLDIHSTQLVRRVLGNIGITNTHLSRNSRDMIGIITERPIDMLICEWDSRPDNGIELTRFLRSPESPNRMLPIIITTSRTDEAEYGQAINAGANEIVTKPFNMKNILTAVIRLIDQPKSFILARNYVGPDRRVGRKRPAHFNEQRRPIVPLVIQKGVMNEVFIDDMPRMILPDFSLKKKIESAATPTAGIEHLLPEAEASKYSEDFVQWMLKDLQTIRQSYRNIVASPESARLNLGRIEEAAVSLRTRGMRSGYSFAARAAIGLNDFCQKHLDPRNPNHLRVMEKHIDTLQAILNANLTGGDSSIGRSLMEELQHLAKKYT